MCSIFFAKLYAVDNPVKPPPITATSTRSGKGCSTNDGTFGALSIQYDVFFMVSSQTEVIFDWEFTNTFPRGAVQFCALDSKHSTLRPRGAR